jgi:aryl-alcohol dehydrogenase-like predicted oxidoreductase
VTKQLLEVAQQARLDPAQMALAFVNQQAFVTSNIVGATNLEQLKVNLESTQIKLSAEILAQLEEIHLAQPNPCP